MGYMGEEGCQPKRHVTFLRPFLNKISQQNALSRIIAVIKITWNTGC